VKQDRPTLSAAKYSAGSLDYSDTANTCRESCHEEVFTWYGTTFLPRNAYA